MFKINNLSFFFKHRNRLISILFLTTINLVLFGQAALVNNGGTIYMQGTGISTNTPTISIFGDYVNRSDQNNIDGTIEQEAGHIWLNGNWINNSLGLNVFTNFTGTADDGFVTFENLNNIQTIDGTSPTHFENIILKSLRKQLINNNNLTQGDLILDAVLDLNSNNFIINNSDPLSLQHTSGFIKSETLPGFYGTVQWNIGAAFGNTYTIPFGSDLSAFDDLNLSINIKSSMGQNNHLTFATYPADLYNYPLPTGSSPLELEPYKVVDRYWIIEPLDPTSTPTADITFTYTSTDIATGFNNLNLKTLKASRNNTTIGRWLDMEPRGTVNGNQVTIQDVLPNEFYAPWTLVNIPGPVANVFVPDAFTPDGDGLNDIFLPVFQADFQIESYEFMIFDRWGNAIFSTKDPTAGWNGRKNNTDGDVKIGVYSWVIIVKGYNYEFGSNLLKDRLRGQVVLYL